MNSDFCMRFLIVFLFFVSIGSYAQSDSTAVVLDTAQYFEAEEEKKLEDATAPDDSTAVTVREFDESRMNELRDDDMLYYKEPPTVAETLWDRFIRWLLELLSRLFSSAIQTDWGNFFTWVLFIAIGVVVVITLLKVDAWRILTGKGAAIKHEVLEENIHEMDFENLIREALAQKDYRKGIRLIFLYALRLLSDRQLIHWQSGKTNLDYVSELDHQELKPGFSRLSYFFEYAWYGNFLVNEATFNKVNQIFQDWRQKVK